MVSVLVADDLQAMRELIRFTLEGEGYTLAEAANGAEALALLHAASEPMVVLLDLVMPIMSGKDVLDGIAADRAAACRHAFILMTASWPLEPTLDEMIGRLGIPLLPKPFTGAELEAAVSGAAARLEDPRAAIVDGDGLR